MNAREHLAAHVWKHPKDYGGFSPDGDYCVLLDDYPILNEDHFSELEWNEVTEYWERSSVADRVDFLQGTNVSVFAARRDEFPQGDDNGALFERLRA